jgi:parallel beta-helix repeat protein
MKKLVPLFMKLILSNLLLIITLTAWSTKYYVDPTGIDDAGRNGTIGQEWATPAYACTRVSAPDTVFINAGDINQGAVQIIRPLGVHIMGTGDNSHIISSFTSASSAQAAIQCASTIGTTTNDGGSISHIRLTGNNLTSTRGIYVGYRNNVWIHDVTLEDFLNGGIWLHVSNNYLSLYATGNRITNCIINNCAQTGADYQGAIRISGQSNCDVMYNTSNMTERAAGNNGSTIEFQRSKKTRITDNTFYRLDHELASYNFFFEGWDYSGDFEYSRNTHYGLAKVSFGGEFNKQDGDCSIGGIAEENIFINDEVGYRTVSGYNATLYAINMEGDNHVNFTITRNYIQNYGVGIELSTPSSGIGYWAHYWDWTNIEVSYNIIDGIGYQDFAYGYGIWWVNETNVEPWYGVFQTIKILNNTIINNYGTGFSGYQGIGIFANGTITNLTISNNISSGFTNYGIYISEHATDTLIINELDATYNCMNGNGTNSIYIESAAGRITVTNFDITTGNITTNPLFISSTNFRLQSESPCINAGIDVGLLSDYLGNPIIGIPDIGAYERYGITYYVKNGGSDGAAGTSDATAWGTITKVNTVWAAGTFAPGDSILFKRGNTFYGTITISESGTIGSPIILGAYGTGDKPIITGLSTLSDWTLYSGNIYQASVSGAEAETNMVLIDGISTAMGRYPDAGTWLTYTTATSSSITDPELPDSPNWTGAEIAINKYDWVIDRCLVTSHSTGGSLQFTNLGGTGGLDPNRKYFFQNDIRCLTTTNEWYHDGGTTTFYIYGDPSSKDIKVATLNKLIYNNGYDYIHINDLALIGSISHAVHLTSTAEYNQILNCEINYAGGSAIENYTGNHTDVHYNTIQHCNNGIYLVGTNINVTNNNINNIAMIAGAPFIAHGTAIFINNTEVTIQYNNIEYTGWSAINTSSIATFTIQYNFINYPVQVLDDGGGIYYTSSSGTRLVDHNIVLNSGVGAPADVAIARGIYLDSYSSGSTVSNNIVAGCIEAGYQVHAGDNNILINNLAFNNGIGILFQKIVGVSENTYAHDNKFIAKDASQICLQEYGYSDAEMQGWGNLNYNYYARPIDDDYVFYYSGLYTLAQYKTLMSPNEANSLGSPISVSSTSDMHFIYNSTKTAKSWTLSTPMVDITNASYSGEISLQPFTGLVLLGTGTVVETNGPVEITLLKSGGVLLKKSIIFLK